MSLPYWYYAGRVTAAIDLPDGPAVITPRSKFYAMPSAVAHLVKVGLVKRLPDPPVAPTPPSVAAVVAAKPAAPPIKKSDPPPPEVAKSVQEKSSIDPKQPETVVASVSESEEGEQSGDGTPVPVESESEQEPSERRRRRRDRYTPQ